MTMGDLFTASAPTVPIGPTATNHSPQTGAGSPTAAASLRKLADVMQKEIDQKRSPRLTNTRKRASEDERMHREADRLEQIQHILQALAEAHRAGAVPEILAYIRTRVQVEALIRPHTLPIGDYSRDDLRRLILAGIIDDATLLQAKAALEGLARQETDPEREQRKRIQALERDLIGQRIPGFFPTPRPVIERMLFLARIAPGMAVLEPSAGKGDLADAIRDHCQGCTPSIRLAVCEINSCLTEILIAKGYDPIVKDFLALNIADRFHRILMNPPFEDGQDMEHVCHAYGLLSLAQPGRLVAVMSAGVFYRADRKARAFRQWLEDVGGWSEELPRDSFKASGTNVAAHLVVIDT